MGRNTLCMLWAAALLAGSAAFVDAQPVARVSPVKTGNSFLNGAPLTLDQVIRIIGQDAIPLRRRKEAIENRGVDFWMSPAAVARLKTAGAPEDLLNLIKSKAQPAPRPPDPPKPPPQGSVSINRAPAECEVALNGAARGPPITARSNLRVSRPEIMPSTWPAQAM